MKQEISEYKGNRVVNIYFSNLTDLHDYLKSDPKVNKRVFDRQASLDPDTDFHGESLEKSIEYCIGGYKKGFNNFLKISNELKELGKVDDDARALKRGLFGGVPLAPLVASNVPDCMLRYDRDEDTKYINVYFNLGYPCITSEEKIINRGLATIYLIEALEEKGYIVNFNAFELSECNNEIINIGINLKKPGDLFLNIEKCYFPMKGKEFLRRILFRVLESADVKNYEWSSGYGRAMAPHEIKQFFNASNRDLIIGAPTHMDIYGNNIYGDTLRLIKALGLNEEFDIEKIKKLEHNSNENKRKL